MHIFYGDESYDQTAFVVSSLRIDTSDWKQVLQQIKQFRAFLRTSYGIKLRAELHARTFVRHCSDGVSSRTLGIAQRRVVFEECLNFISTLPIQIINICLPLKKFNNSSKDAHFAALDRLFNRIQTNISRLQPPSYAITIFDTGKEKEITKLSRRLGAFNNIPSQFGYWPGGVRVRNIVTDRIIEDPVFRDSRDSYFLQLADFVAFALLKREVPITPFVHTWGYNTLFNNLRPVLCRAASPRDPDGVVRG